jgi:hypothetical protein
VPPAIDNSLQIGHMRQRLGLLAMPAIWLLPLLAGAALAGETAARPWNFENDILPILSKYGCNSSGCHGKAEGQNGFKLSVFGFDPEADYRAIVMEGRGRRVFPAAPDKSLLLLKIGGGMPHGGGVRLDAARPEFDTLRAWIASGTRFGLADDPRVTSIAVSPGERQLAAGATQQLTVHATWSDGRVDDVTAMALYQSNQEGLATVDERGLVTCGDTPGTVAVMASYLGFVDAFRAMIPRQADSAVAAGEPPANFIDRLVQARLQQLNIEASPTCDDATFARRVYLDILGRLPEPAEIRAFLGDAGDDRRERLVDALLERPEYADYWALQWADLLRVNRRELGRKGAYLYYSWIRDSFAANKRWDQLARELITAEGPLSESPAGYFFKVAANPNVMASTVSQVFLGVRIDCAQCHHHPWDRWGQSDYFGMQAMFTQVAFKPSASGDVLGAFAAGKSLHPRTGQEVFAHPLGNPAPEAQPAGDRRKQLAEWLTAAGNPWFARNLANRTWAHFLGRGLVEPVDDFRLTNPPSNPELLDALAQSLVDSGYDQKHLIRLITASRTYQRSSQPNSSNADDEQNYSRFPFKPLPAEVLYDAICQATGVSEKFDGIPLGVRAVQLWDSEVPHYFLRIFGRPSRVTACDCERVGEPTVGQVLHVLNSPEIGAKISHAGGRVARYVSQMADNDQLTNELYLTFFSRLPAADEQQQVVRYLDAAADRRLAAEDVAWSMLNSLEFLYNH